MSISYKTPLLKYIAKICTNDLLFFFKVQWLIESFGAFASNKSAKFDSYRDHIQKTLEALELSAINAMTQPINDSFDPQAVLKKNKIKKLKRKNTRAQNIQPIALAISSSPHINEPLRSDSNGDEAEREQVILRCETLRQKTSNLSQTRTIARNTEEVQEMKVVREYMKGIRLEFKDTMAAFLKSLINNCFALKREKIEHRKKMTKSLMLKTNTWLWERKLKKTNFDSCELPVILNYAKALKEGVLFPFERDPAHDYYSNMIVRIIHDDSTCFNTKKRVPYRVVCETIDYNELIAGVQPQYEKDIEFEFIQARFQLRAAAEGAGKAETDFDTELPNGDEDFLELEKQEPDSLESNDKINKYKSLEAFVQKKREEMESQQSKTLLQRINEIAALKILERNQNERENGAGDNHEGIGNQFFNFTEKLNPFRRKATQNLDSQSNNRESVVRINLDAPTPGTSGYKNKAFDFSMIHNQTPKEFTSRSGRDVSLKKEYESERLEEIPEHEKSIKEESNQRHRTIKSKSFIERTRSASKRETRKRSHSVGFDFMSADTPEVIGGYLKFLKEIVLGPKLMWMSKRRIWTIRELYKQVKEKEMNLIQKEKSKIDWGALLKEVFEEKRGLGPWDSLWRSRKIKIAETSPYSHFKSYQVRSIIMKGGDDLRMEILAMQLIKRFCDIFKGAGSSLYVLPYEILVLSADSGVLQFVPDSISIDQLKKKYPGKSLRAIYEEIFKKNFLEAQKNFIESLAAYSLLTYLLQIKDR